MTTLDELKRLQAAYEIQVARAQEDLRVAQEQLSRVTHLQISLAAQERVWFWNIFDDPVLVGLEELDQYLGGGQYRRWSISFTPGTQEPCLVPDYPKA